MNLEIPQKNVESNEARMMIVGMENNIPIYEEMKTSYPKELPDIPKEAYDVVAADMRNLKSSSELIRYQPGEILSLKINSEEKARYEILDFKNGYYLMAKIDFKKVVYGVSECVVVLSNAPRNKENPDLIVCNEKEIRSWLSS